MYIFINYHARRALTLAKSPLPDKRISNWVGKQRKAHPFWAANTTAKRKCQLHCNFRVPIEWFRSHVETRENPCRLSQLVMQSCALRVACCHCWAKPAEHGARPGVSSLGSGPQCLMFNTTTHHPAHSDTVPYGYVRGVTSLLC